MSRKATLDALFAPRPSAKPEAAPELKSAGEEFHNVLGAPNTSAPAESRASAVAAVVAAMPEQRMNAEQRMNPERIRSGAIGAMGASLQQLKASAGEAEDLRRSLAAGEHVLEIDPALIDPAPVADRFHTDDDVALAELVHSMRESGQQVPVLVRPHPATEGRWQAAYGHRRIRAATALGIPVKAIVRQLSDEALAIAQGKENLDRRDLTYIEKAFFAAGLERAGFSRATLGQALSADKADVSRYLAIARETPEMLARLVGPAPRVGRARWAELAEASKAAGPRLGDVIELLPQLQVFQRADSDVRFRIALARLVQKPLVRTAAPALVADAEGRAVAVLNGEGPKRRIEMNEALAPGFARFVADMMPVLYDRWRTANADAEPKPQPE
ncbi:MAG: plasmid partitioning protein RepB [Beijerinckiaceae bacterium]